MLVQVRSKILDEIECIDLCFFCCLHVSTPLSMANVNMICAVTAGCRYNPSFGLSAAVRETLAPEGECRYVMAITPVGRESAYHWVDISGTGGPVSEELEFSGNDRIVIPSGYLASIDAAVEMHSEQIDAVAVNLEVASLESSRSRRLLWRGILAVALWLAPAIWMMFD